MSQADGQDEQIEQSAEEGEITWVGAQHLMQGYCGRAVRMEQSAESIEALGEEKKVRPIALVRTKPWQGRVVRIGPPRNIGEVSSEAA